MGARRSLAAAPSTDTKGSGAAPEAATRGRQAPGLSVLVQKQQEDLLPQSHSCVSELPKNSKHH